MERRNLDRRTYEALQTELEFLKRKGVLSSETVETISNVYEPPATRGRDFHQLVFLAMTTLGVLALGFAAFLVLRYHWNEFTPFAKTAVVLSLLAAAYLGSFVAGHFKKNLLAELFMFSGAILFGVNIWQIAQIYQFNVSFPAGFWIWGGGAFLLAIFARLPILHYLVVGIFSVLLFSLFSEGSFCGVGSVLCEEFIFYMTFPIFAAFGVAWGARRRFPSVSILYCLFLTLWGLLPPFTCQLDAFYFLAVTIWGGIFWFWGAFLINDKEVAKVARILGSAMVLLFLIPQTFWDTYDYTFRSSWTLLGHAESVVFFTVLLVFFAGSVLYAVKKRSLKRNSYTGTSRAVAVFSPVGVALASIALQFFSLACFQDFDELLPLYADVLSVGLAWFFILTGAKGRLGRYWIGTLYFVLWAILRYIDLFSDLRSVLHASLFFLFIAAVLFVAAYLFEKKVRRRIVKNVSPETMSSGDVESDVDVEQDGATLDGLCQPPSICQPPNATVLRIGICVTILLQFATIFGMIAVQTLTFAQGTQICVEASPIDPTDFFRGDYVTLHYSFSSKQGVEWVDDQRREVFDVSALNDSPQTKHVYIKLKFNPEDGVYRPVAMTPDVPKLGENEIFLRGRCRFDRWNVTYGIESFFLQEGTGRDIERAAMSGSKKILVDLLVTPTGKARVENVRLIDLPHAIEIESTNSENPTDVENLTDAENLLDAENTMNAAVPIEDAAGLEEVVLGEETEESKNTAPSENFYRPEDTARAEDTSDAEISTPLEDLDASDDAAPSENPAGTGELP